MARRRVLLTMSPYAQKLMAKRWFRAGFYCSGYGFHGERITSANTAIKSLITAEFDRLWSKHE